MVIAVSTVFSAGFLALVWKLPRVARWLTGVGFVVASGVNGWTVLTEPELYVQAFGPSAVWGYRQFIYGPFAAHTAWFVLPIAVMQLVVGALALMGSRVGPLGAMVFLIAITPLGAGSGFPGPPLLAYGMWRLYRQAYTQRDSSGGTTSATQ